MAGQYGEIDSRADYHRVLGEAANSVTRMLARTPADAPLLRINKQLAAMKRWTDNGRAPSDGERRNIDVGLIAVRELSEPTGEVSDLAQKLFVLNNYFEDWPTDAEAASATDEDFDDD
jgi:hypothetical protein